jgi:glycosyltransferase involved in cell wall biosynthesis
MIGLFLSSSGRLFSVSESLAEHLRRAGWQVTTTSHRVARIARGIDILATVWRKRRSVDVAVVDVYSGLAFAWAAAACCVLRLLGTPYVLTLHGGNLPALARRWRGVMQTLLRSAHAVTVPSEYLRREMAAYRAGLRLHPNPIAFSKMAGRVRVHAAPRMIWVRSFHHLYNPAMAIRTLAIVRQRFPDATLTMVGGDREDGSRGEALALAAELGVESHLRLAGYVPASDVSRWLADADIFLNTASVDNTPVSLLEALAAGLCVVTTNVGGIPDLVTSEKDALLVGPGNATAMAEAVLRIIEDPVLARQLSTAARAKAATYDWSEVLPLWEQLLRATAAGQRVPA